MEKLPARCWTVTGRAHRIASHSHVHHRPMGRSSQNASWEEVWVREQWAWEMGYTPTISKNALEKWWKMMNYGIFMGFFRATLSKPVVFVAPYIMESEKDGLTMPHDRNPIQIRCAMTAMVVLLWCLTSTLLVDPTVVNIPGDKLNPSTSSPFFEPSFSVGCI